MLLKPLFDPADFRIPEGIAHVCAGGETPFLKRHDDALLRYAADKSLGMAGRAAQEAQLAHARALIAQSWSVGIGDIGFVGSVADGVSLVAESLNWRAGDNAVFDTDEYPSVVAPFALRPRAALRFATGHAPDRMARLVDARTRLIGVSYVSFLTGERANLAALRRLADSVGALLVVDFTQAAGYLPIQVQLADFAFSACYKWLLGTTGVAIGYWNRARLPDWAPATAGWHSLASHGRPDYSEPLELVPDAMRMTRGNPGHAALYVLASALDYLRQHDARAIHAHVEALASNLLFRLAALQIPSTTPEDPARRGGNVCISHPRAQAIVDALAERGVWAWNGRGRIRFSFHGYNGGDDVEKIITALRATY
ncbi:MAG: aminotransferase class V-fold PLP-dependent enzyme [Acetobacteraceae bacterium]|nr:aminotransferase class V-fold PLP-dependent enzyme [Acetobacteraceae bacterium]